MGKTACYIKPISETVVIDTILITLDTLINSMINIKKAMKNDNDKMINKTMNKMKQDIDLLGIELAKYQKAKACLYTDFVSGDINKSDYEYMGKEFTDKCFDIENKIKKLDNELYDYNNSSLSDNKAFNTYIEYKGINTLTRRTAVALIDKITVDKEHCIKIMFKFSDEIKKYQYNL